MDKGIDAERSMCPEESSRNALDKRKTRAPHERTICENPEVFVCVERVGIHGRMSRSDVRGQKIKAHSLSRENSDMICELAISDI
jgi:hypothetical protein